LDAAFLRGLLVACTWLMLQTVVLWAAEPLREPGFTFLWWSDGPPGYLFMKGPPPPPVLCFRSGNIGLRLETKSLRFLNVGRFKKQGRLDDSLQESTSALLKLPPLNVRLSVVQSGTEFLCVGRGPDPKDEFFQPVRFVETGRFLQRVRIEGLQFEAANGTRLACDGSVEVSLWPDRLALALDLNGREESMAGELVIEADGKRASRKLGSRGSVELELVGPGESAPRAQIEAPAPLAVTFDTGLGCYQVRLPEQPWSNTKGTGYPEEHLDRLDRWPITLRNGSSREVVARLMFVQEQHLPITGFTPMLCEPDGTPSGLPVQLSKNWHSRPEKGRLLHQGPWFHGCAVVRLPAGSRRDLVLQMVYARYGGVFAVSHAHLCLIGWGHNQFWDQAALGSFGENICYEPGRVQRRCAIDDIRPFATLWGEDAKLWSWSGNAGGGDFLVWEDEQGHYQGFRGTRINYRSHGPCLTEVRYLEETAGGEISATMDVSLARSDDYLRAFHRFRYDVVKPVRFSRLAFYQLGADFYNETPARQVAFGDAGGLGQEWRPPRAQGAFDQRAIPLPGSSPWISVHDLDRARLDKGGAAASRGLIIRSWRARLGGNPSSTPHLSTYCNSWGQDNWKTAVELSPPPGINSLKPGDFVEAEVELVMFPADPQAYYGTNEEFRKALAAGADTWRLVQSEAAGNHLRITAKYGKVKRAFPLVMEADGRNRAVARVDGGLGWLPVTFTGLDSSRGYRLLVNGEPLEQSIHGNDFWQTDYDPTAAKWCQTFNVPRRLGEPLRLEFGRSP
jgi:hypothetical protein